METRLNTRNKNADLLKIVACIAVVGIHSVERDASLLCSTLYYLCGFAIPVFWMASGAFLMNRGAIEISYSFRKIASILKVVIIWNVLLSAALAVGRFFLNTAQEFSISTIPKDIVRSLVQRGWFSHFWYFGALIIIYILLPLLSRLPKKLKVVATVVSGVTGIVLQLISMILGGSVQGHVIQTFRFWTWCFYFCLGGLLYDKKEAVTVFFCRVKEKCSWIDPKIILAALTVAVLIYQNIVGRLVIKASDGVLRAEFFYDSILTILWTAALFVCIMGMKMGEISNKFAERMTPITMGIYIAHPLLLRVYKGFVSVDSALDSYICFIVILFCSAAISFVIHKIPFIRNLIKI